jgi:hypothetical protein
MKTNLLLLTLAAVLNSPAFAQINFDSPSAASLAGLFSAGDGGVPAPEPEIVQDTDAAACESFSFESGMRYIPIYDQMLSRTPEDDSQICHAATAAQMFDHWNLSHSSSGAPELISPLMLHAVASLRSAQEGRELEPGGELNQETLQGMAQDACTLGVAAGSRQFLSVNEEARLALASRGAAQEQGGKPGQEESAGLSGRKAFEAVGDPSTFRSPPCRQLPVQGFKPLYQRPSQRRMPNGRLERQPFTLEEFRGFFLRNNAAQPVAVKVSYNQIFGDGQARTGDNHWALIIARQHQAGRCQYLLRNSMGSETPLIWVDEVRMQYGARSLAVLAR